MRLKIGERQKFVVLSGGAGIKRLRHNVGIQPCGAPFIGSATGDCGVGEQQYYR